MDKITIVEQIRGNEKLLSLPQALSQVLQEVSKEDFSPDNLAGIILKDPSLTGQILRMANSPFYHRLSEITTVNQAVSVMGATTVKCLALSTSVLNPDKIAKESGMDTRAFFTHVLSVAAASESIAQVLKMKNTEEAFISGLLHDVGVLFFLHHYPQEYAHIIQQQVRANSLSEVENEVFGIDHAEVGFHMAERWCLPSYITSAIGNHHRPPTENQEPLYQHIVSLAVLLAGDQFSGYEPSLEDRLRSIKEVSGELGLSQDQVDEISSSLLARTVDVAEYLKINIGNIEEMLVRANQEIWKSYITVENLFKERSELSASLLREERAKGAAESKTIAMATLSHYLNNVAMAIYGRSQLMRMLLNKGERDRLADGLPHDLDIVDQSIAKLVAVLEEMREISPIDEKEFYTLSRGLNIDDRIATRMATMSVNGSWSPDIKMDPVPG